MNYSEFIIDALMLSNAIVNKWMSENADLLRTLNSVKAVSNLGKHNMANIRHIEIHQQLRFIPAIKDYKYNNCCSFDGIYAQQLYNSSDVVIPHV